MTIRKRSFIFSRWGGLGNHRYPIGFSGDTVITWGSLAFQPTFTSTAANVGYGWWSHDIGGHFGGIEDSELYTRWVQYGFLSPILRLHSTKNRFLERRPFGWDAETLRLTRHALQLRHRFIPYLYTMSWRDHSHAEAPIRPMYHDYPDRDEAYFTPDQYTFGSELIAAPHIQPHDPHTHLSRQVVWLPHEAWNFFTGQHYAPGWHALYGTLDDIPLFAKPGAIVPLCDWQDWRNPSRLEVHIFPHADNHFDLYEDDGETTAFHNGHFTLTPFDLKWENDRGIFILGPATGDLTLLPQQREYTLHFHGVGAPQNVSVTLNGNPAPAFPKHDPKTQTLTFPDITLTPSDTLIIEFRSSIFDQPNRESKIENLQRIVTAFRLDNTVKQVLYDNLPDLTADPSKLAAFHPSLQPAHLRALLETITGAGIHRITHTNEDLVILWNNDAQTSAQTSEVSGENTSKVVNPQDFGSLSVNYQLSTENTRVWQAHDRFQVERGPVPLFKSLNPGREMEFIRWKLALQYGNVLVVSLP